MTFDKISGAVDPKDVTVKVTYKDVAKTAEFRVELGSGVKYYVDATNGKDSNNGTSPETAWQTIDRVNQENSSRETRFCLKQERLGQVH